MLQGFKAMMRFREGAWPDNLKERFVDTALMDYGNGDLFIHTDSQFERSIRTITCAKESDTIRWIIP